MNDTGNNPSLHPQWQPEYFGDTVIVNGKAWPRLSVRRRKYRFRILNASNARFYRFFIANGLKFVVIGSDSAYLHLPVTANELLLAPSEIADVIVDFSESISDEVDKRSGTVMKFVIDVRGKDASHPGRIPAEHIRYPRAMEEEAVQTRYIAMYEYTSSSDEPTHLYLNGKSFDEPATETPSQGTTEMWEVINLTEDNHPMHIHLGLLSAVSQVELLGVDELAECMKREKNDVIKCNMKEHVTD